MWRPTTHYNIITKMSSVLISFSLPVLGLCCGWRVLLFVCLLFNSFPQCQSTSYPILKLMLSMERETKSCNTRTFLFSLLKLGNLSQEIMQSCCPCILTIHWHNLCIVLLKIHILQMQHFFLLFKISAFYKLPHKLALYLPF